MTEATKTKPSIVGEITVDSDWITFLGTAFLFILSGLLLVGEIDKFILGHLVGPVRLQRDFVGIFTKVAPAICCFMVVFGAFRNKPVKVASALLGANFAGFFILSCIPISSLLQHIAAVSGSVIRQIALLIFCLATAKWLRSVIRRRPVDSSGGQS